MSIIQRIPSELTELPQWVLWCLEQRDGKDTKVPHQARRGLYCADHGDRRTWASFELALEMWQWHGDRVNGIGFVFSETDAFCGIDLDNCYPSDAAEVAPWAEGILEIFSDTYAEQSPSGKGVKIWCRAKAPRCGRWLVESGAVEIYDHLRYFTLTGNSNRVLTVADHQEDIDELVADLDQERSAIARKPTFTSGAMGATMAGPIPKGRRHPTLLSHAGSMWRRGMDAAAVEAALLIVNERQCDPPYSPGHIRKIVASMSRWPR